MAIQTDTTQQDMRPGNDPDMFLYNVAVGFTTHRPVRPDEHMSQVTLMAADDSDAIRTAIMIVCQRPGVEMPTSSAILSVEL